ncbi:MAG: membrane protein [Myxococcales bacterium]
MSDTRPSQRALRAAERALGPWWRATSPRFMGTDRIPGGGPLLFIGNHTLFGVLDAPLMFMHLWRERGIVLRGLGDHTHFRIPVWRTLLAQFGVMDGTRENCARLMRAGEHLLVFPGGGREVSKRKGEKYKLIWRERLGFAHMAIAYDCPILPFAAVGVEDMFDIVRDADELLAGPLGHVARRLGVRSDVVWPVVRGRRSLLPRPERLYFHFGDPIQPPPPGDDPHAAARGLRDRVKAAVEAGIEELLQAQRDDAGHGARSRTAATDASGWR